MNTPPGTVNCGHWLRLLLAAGVLTQCGLLSCSPGPGKPTVADFDAQGIVDSLNWLSRTLERVEAATLGDLNAGDHCKWCRAKAVCSAFREAALEPVSNMAISLLAILRRLGLHCLQELWN